MKIKNIAAGDSVQIKKSLCYSGFKAKQVCEVVDIDPTDKYGFDVLIRGKNCLDWVNHKHLKKPEPQLKQLDQSVFDGLDEKWRFAAVNAAGRLTYSKTRMVHDKKYWWASSKSSDLSSGTDGYDTSNWQNSLIERDIAKESAEVNLSSELTGSELCRAMLGRSNEYVMCLVGDECEESAKNSGIVRVICSRGADYFDDTTEDMWYFAIPINNQGEPLTASEVGL